jgi:hypothetical protein
LYPDKKVSIAVRLCGPSGFFINFLYELVKAELVLGITLELYILYMDWVVHVGPCV